MLGSWKFGRLPAVNLTPAFVKQAVNFGLENKPPARPLPEPEPPEAFPLPAAGAEPDALEVVVEPLALVVPLPLGLPLVLAPDGAPPVDAPPGAATVPLSVRRA